MSRLARHGGAEGLEIAGNERRYIMFQQLVAQGFDPTALDNVFAELGKLRESARV